METIKECKTEEMRGAIEQLSDENQSYLTGVLEALNFAQNSLVLETEEECYG